MSRGGGGVIPIEERKHWCPWCEQWLTFVGAVEPSEDSPGGWAFTGCEHVQQLHDDYEEGDCWCEK